MYKTKKRNAKRGVLMKKAVIIILFIVTITGGILLTKKQFHREENVKKEEKQYENNIYSLEYSASYAIDLNDLEEMYNGHEFIALIHVDKLYPATTYKENIDEYIMPYTPGEATILKVLKGNFASEHISFLRLGGTVSYAEYEKSLPPSAREKFAQSFTDEKKFTTYIKNMSKGDIDIERGKNYLVYMNRSDDFHNKNEYTIEAYEYGLREVNLDYNTFSIDSLSITIKNNKTGKYENLEKAVSERIVKQFKTTVKE